MEWNDFFNFAEDSRCFGEGNVGGWGCASATTALEEVRTCFLG